ncbi:thymidylate synthase [Hokovirus HKV1]|mgnify:CR=1 FL=1|uniref:thymidylate synthase n=1 Tax=Hokovirus HKV1 TaxID=1977638 RepID=A0A1V0SGT4_9VIRU|nr:thymidylate synthase [Hokovirus HKV1]
MYKRIHLYILDKNNNVLEKLNNPYLYKYIPNKKISNLDLYKHELFNVLETLNNPYLYKFITNKSGLEYHFNLSFVNDLKSVKNNDFMTLDKKYLNDDYIIIKTNVIKSNIEFPENIFLKYLLSKKKVINHTYEEINDTETNTDLTIDYYSIENNNLTFYGEQGYLKLLEHVLNCENRNTRNSTTFASFGHQLSFDLQEGFPLLTTKKVLFDKVISELLMFLKGETNTKTLEEQGNYIWKHNTDAIFLSKMNLVYPVGFMGPMYGYNWRFYGKPYLSKNKNVKYIDQLHYVIKLLLTDPTSRRIIMTTYDPLTVDQCVLYPCHGLITQFFVRDNEYLDIKMYQRSADLFLGVPFNIASYALLNEMLCKITGYKPGILNITFGDVHIYKDHLEAVQTQINRKNNIHQLPKLLITKEYQDNNNINDAINYITNLEQKDFTIENYCHEPFIKASMIP